MPGSAGAGLRRLRAAGSGRPSLGRLQGRGTARKGTAAGAQSPAAPAAPLIMKGPGGHPEMRPALGQPTLRRFTSGRPASSGLHSSSDIFPGAG